MAGYHNFAASEVLTAANMDGFLMEQSIIAVPSGSYPTTVHEGMVVYDTTEKRLYVYNGTAWVRTTVNGNKAGRTGMRLRRASTQLIQNHTATAIAWDTDDDDTDGFHTGSSDTITIPTSLQAGVYAMAVRVAWNVDPCGGGFAYVEIDSAGRNFRNDSVAQGVANGGMSVSCIDELNAGDTVHVNVYQTAASNYAINIGTAQFRAWRLAL